MNALNMDLDNLLQKKQIKLCQISTHTQIADMLTKGLNKIKFQDLRSLAGMTRIRIKGKC